MTPHGGDHLSALADGELSPERARDLEGHVAGCARCARELEEVHEARRAVRSLPPVQPPAGWFDSLIAAGPPVPRPVPLARRRYGLARAAASVAAAAALVVLSTTAVSRPSVDVAVDGAVEDHASTVSALSAAGFMPQVSTEDISPGSSVTPTTNEPLTVDRIAAPYRAPQTLAGGYTLTQGFHHPDGVQLVYERSDHTMSVFESEGRVEWGRLDGGQRLDLVGHRGWLLETGDAAGNVVVVVQLDGLTVALVGAEGGSAVVRAAESLPGPRPLSMLQRLRRSAKGAIRTLSLG